MFYNLSDTRIVGSILGKNALAAVGATTSLSNLIIGFLTGMTNGFSILIARTFGAKLFEDMKKAIIDTSNDIISGKMETNPKSFGGKLVCDTCEHRAICRRRNK